MGTSKIKPTSEPIFSISAQIMVTNDILATNSFVVKKHAVIVWNQGSVGLKDRVIKKIGYLSYEA